jgi:[ribosomal protein S5]-alanine N-acetyltransferase
LSVHLLTPDLGVLDAALAGREELERALGCDVADGWDVFPESLPRVREALADDPRAARWGTRFFVLEKPPTLVGWGGFKGAPRDGVVELGYAIAPSFEGRGLATAAVREMLQQALADPAVRRVIAHTLPKRNASVRVLEKAGFVHDGDVADDDVGTVWRFRLDRQPSRLSADRPRAVSGWRT